MRLKELRKALSKTQQQVADELNMHKIRCHSMKTESVILAN